MSMGRVRIVAPDNQTKNNHTSNLGEYTKTGGPGRTLGSKNHRGLSEIIDLIESIISAEPNKKKLAKHFQTLFDKSPAGFYAKFVFPLLPKNFTLEPPEGFDLTIIYKNLDMSKHPPVPDDKDKK